MPRPLTILDEDVLRRLLNRVLPLEETDYPDALREGIAADLVLRDIQGEASANPEDSGPGLLLEGLEPGKPVE